MCRTRSGELNDVLLWPQEDSKAAQTEVPHKGFNNPSQHVIFLKLFWTLLTQSSLDLFVGCCYHNKGWTLCNFISHSLSSQIFLFFHFPGFFSAVWKLGIFKMPAMQRLRINLVVFSVFSLLLYFSLFQRFSACFLTRVFLSSVRCVWSLTSSLQRITSPYLVYSAGLSGFNLLLCCCCGVCLNIFFSLSPYLACVNQLMFAHVYVRVCECGYLCGLKWVCWYLILLRDCFQSCVFVQSKKRGVWVLRCALAY